MKPFTKTVEQLFDGSAVEPNFGCWIWLGRGSANGYPYFGQGKRGPRAVWEMANGTPFPEGKLACHKCDVKHCVNPDHIYVGTKSDNGKDAVRTGRFKYASPGTRVERAGRLIKFNLQKHC